VDYPNEMTEIERFKILAHELDRCMDMYFRAIVIYLFLIGGSIKVFFDLHATTYAKPFWVLVQGINVLGVVVAYLFMVVALKIGRSLDEVGPRAGIPAPGVPRFVFHGAVVAVFLGVAAWIAAWFSFLAA